MSKQNKKLQLPDDVCKTSNLTRFPTVSGTALGIIWRKWEGNIIVFMQHLPGIPPCPYPISLQSMSCIICAKCTNSGSLAWQERPTYQRANYILLNVLALFYHLPGSMSNLGSWEDPNGFRDTEVSADPVMAASESAMNAQVGRTLSRLRWYLHNALSLNVGLLIDGIAEVHDSYVHWVNKLHHCHEVPIDHHIEAETQQGSH